MNPLRYRVVNKRPGFSNEMIHIRDNCFVFMDSQFVEIVIEHEDSLECHGFSRNALKESTMKQILEQPTFKAANDELMNIIVETVYNQTIKGANSCEELRSACKCWRDSHYIHKVYDSYRASVYAFMYSLAGGNTVVCLQAINYGKRDMEGSFAVDKDIIEKIYDIIAKRG